ncbi:31444_t:CDS:2, partial [Racocetra persica]
YNKWEKILTRRDLPEYQMKYKEPHVCDENVKQYSGYLTVNNTKNIFFWFFESRNKPQEDPIVLWLTGGPGCSGLSALFFEIGPCTVNKEGNSTIFNPYSWNNNASVIFLDQPANTGYSYGGDVSTTLEAATDMYTFLQAFFHEFPKYSNLSFHIAGGSYYPDMACNSSYGPVLNKDTCDQMRRDYPKCASEIQECYDSQDTTKCRNATMNCFTLMLTPYNAANRSTFDIRIPCDDSQMCYSGLRTIEDFSNRENFRAELGVNSTSRFQACDHSEVYPKFMQSGDIILRFDQLIPPLLENNIRVLIYAGDADFICNWFGNEAWVKQLEWSGKEGFNNANVTRWITKDTAEYAGDVRTFKGFTLLKIFNAGHMPPHDQPRSCLDFFNRWLFKESL